MDINKSGNLCDRANKSQKKNRSETIISSETLNNALFEESKQEEVITQCICARKSKTLVCVNCKMFTYGRITKKCPEHTNVTFLMDFICCPNCKGPAEMLRGVDVEYSLCQSVNHMGKGFTSGASRFLNNY